MGSHRGYALAGVYLLLTRGAMTGVVASSETRWKYRVSLHRDGVAWLGPSRDALDARFRLDKMDCG